jgi:hypothetical protein
MNCYCAIFFIDGKKFISECDKCKNQPINVPIKYIFKWNELHIKILRDYPTIRLFIELFILCGYTLWALIIYLKHFEIFDITTMNILNKLLIFYFMIYIIILFSYIHGVTELHKNDLYKLD